MSGARSQAPSPKTRLTVHSLRADLGGEKAFGITPTPATAVIGAQDYGVRFYGMPAGYEFATLLDLIIAVSQGSTAIAPPTRELLTSLSQDIHVQVFVTPT